MSIFPIKLQHFFLELRYFFLYFQLLLNNLLIFTSFKNSSKIYFFYNKLNWLYRHALLDSSINFLVNKKIYNFVSFKKITNSNLKNKHVLFSTNIKSQKIVFKNDNITELRLFNIFFFFNYSLFDYKFKTHANFKLFYLTDSTSPYLIVDTSKFLARWKNSYFFLYNIFFHNCNPIIFGSFIFKKEILALNWHYNFFEINLWRYFFLFFFLKRMGIIKK